MGNAIGSLFGMNNSYEPPEMPKQDPVPVREASVEPESGAARNEERRKLRARRAMNGTILTSPLGAAGSGSATGAASGILGQSL